MIPTPFSEPINNNNQNIISEQKKEKTSLHQNIIAFGAIGSFGLGGYALFVQNERFEQERRADSAPIDEQRRADKNEKHEDIKKQNERFEEQRRADKKQRHDVRMAPKTQKEAENVQRKKNEELKEKAQRWHETMETKEN